MNCDINVQNFTRNIDVKKVDKKLSKKYSPRWYRYISLDKQRIYHMASVQKMTLPVVLAILFLTKDINFFSDCMRDDVKTNEKHEALNVEIVDL